MTRLPEEGEKEAPQAWSDGGTEPRVTSCVCVCVCQPVPVQHAGGMHGVWTKGARRRCLGGQKANLQFLKRGPPGRASPDLPPLVLALGPPAKVCDGHCPRRDVAVGAEGSR